MSVSVEASSLHFEDLPPDVQKAIDNAIGAGFDTSRKIGESRFRKKLKARKITRVRAQMGVQIVSDFFSLPKLIFVFLILIAVIFGASYVFSCGGPWSGHSECRTQIVEEHRTPYTESHSGYVASVRVQRTVLTGLPFNSTVFSVGCLVAALFLAVARWHIGNRQTAMSELFERKRSINLLLIEKGDILKDLVSGALNVAYDNRRRKKVCCFNKSKCRDVIVNSLKNWWPQEERSIEQQIYVYMELDNLEFAHMKYQFGYLESEQMYRACQIFESRCQSKLFRHLAVVQGLTYSTYSFRNIIVSLVIFGYAESEENIIKCGVANNVDSAR